MAKITDPSKLLPSSKLSSTLAKGGKGNTINIVSKSTLLQKSPKNKKESKKEKKDSDDIREKLINIEKFLKSSFTTSQKKAEVKRKQKEKEDFDEAEKKLETPKTKAFKLPGISLPSIGFFERIKRFLFFTALGWLVPKIIEFLPKLKGLGNIIGGVYKFAEGMFGKLFDGFMSLVKFGGDLKNKTLGFIASAKAGVGGNYETEFKKLENQFNTFANLSIVAGLLATDIGLAAVDEYNKWNKKNKGANETPRGATGAKIGTKGYIGRRLTPKELKDLNVKPGSTEARSIQKSGTKAQRATTKQQRKIQGAQIRAGLKETKPVKPPSWWQKTLSRLKGGPFAKLSGPFAKFLGSAVPFAGAAVGAIDAKSRFDSGDKIGGWMASISAALDAFAGGAAILTAGSAATVLGLPIAAVAGAAATIATGISMGIDILLLVRDILGVIGIKTFNKGGRVVKKYQGGGTTRGGRPVGGPPRRTLRTSNKLKKPPKVSLPKTQPGKDVGGEKKIKEFYAKPEDPNKKYLRPSGGWLSTLFGDKKQDLSVFDTLNKMSGTLKSDQTIAKGILGLMSSGIDMALGQKPDKKIFKSFFDTIAYISDTLANQRASKSMSSLMSQIRGFAEGGSVPSRELRRTYQPNTSDLLAKILEPTIEQKVNEAIQSIQKELMLQGGKKEESPSTSPGGGDSDGTGTTSISDTKFSNEINEASKISGMNAAQIAAMMKIESGFDPNNTSDSGARGLMQLMPGTYKELYNKYGSKYKLEDSITNPRTNAILGSLYMRDLYNGPANKNLETMVKMYNAGPAGNLSGTQPTNHWKKFEKAYSGFKETETASVSFDAKVDPSKFRKITGTSGQSQGSKPLSVPYSPFTSSVGNPAISSGKGWRWGREHKGLDIEADEGTPMYSYLPGTITFSGSMSGYGYRIEWKDSNGNLHSYSHLQKNPGFRVGQKIEQGQLLGYVGKTGRSTGPHLHWEIKNSSGTYLDPVQWTNQNPLPKPKKKPEISEKPKPPSSQPSSSQSLFSPAQQLELQRLFNQRRETRSPQELEKFLRGSSSPVPKPTSLNDFVKGKKREGVIKYRGQTYFRIGNQYYEEIPGRGVFKSDKRIYDMVPRMQGGGLIGPKSSRLPIPNSFASYETYGNGPMIVIQPMIIEKQVPIYSAKNSPITFPVPVSVNNSSAQSLSRG